MTSTDDVKLQLWQLVKRQGLPFIILLMAVWYIRNDNEILRAELRKSQEEIKAYYKSDNQQMLKVIERNNEVIDRNNRIFEKFVEKH